MIDVKVNEKVLEEAGRALLRVSAKMISLSKKILNKNSRLLQTHVRTAMLTGGTSSNRLAVRSGRLRASTLPVPATQTEASIVAGISFGTVYARMHIGPKGQTTTVKPKRSKYLAIPLDAARTKAGVAKGSPRDAVFGKTFVKMSKKGNLIIFGQGTKKSGGITPLFVLKKQVTVKARVHPKDMIDWVEPKIILDFKEGTKA